MINVIVLCLALKVPYYYDRRIHNLGYSGFQGKIHAESACISTKIIDRICYNGRDVRKEIVEDYKNENVLDLCCGVGISTMENSIGIDTSYEMLTVALKNNIKENLNKNFYFGNAEIYKPDIKPDIVTCMFAFHEMPLYAQCRIIENAMKITNKEIIIVDIASSYQPNELILSREPYLLNYLKSIDNTLSCFEKQNYIQNQVDIWRYKM
jgi:ubiquinone/menaquinone biosynthesis C-methylase UbiE